VVEVAAPMGLVFLGLLIRTIFGAIVVVAVALFLWKAAKLLDAYAEKLKAK